MCLCPNSEVWYKDLDDIKFSRIGRVGFVVWQIRKRIEMVRDIATGRGAPVKGLVFLENLDYEDLEGFQAQNSMYSTVQARRRNWAWGLEDLGEQAQQDGEKMALLRDAH